MSILKREEVARTLEEFTKIVSTLEKEAEGRWLWFRGQASAQWNLVPKLYRFENAKAGHLTEDKGMREDDDENREQFVMRAANLSDVRPTNNWDWYFVMQHYGAPTRLLDWTEGALLGLYFAIRENKGYDDAVVWVFNPWELNKKVVHSFEVIPPGEPGTAKEDKKRYEKWLGNRFAKRRWARWPAAIYPGHILRRIGAQRSCFTVHGADRRGLELIAQKLGIPLYKIMIPSWRMDSLKESLVTCGIDETTVFPDLEGLGRSSMNYWKEPVETKPHDGVYTRLRPSKVHKGGVGVFAIRRINRGTELFRGDCEEMVWKEKSDLPQIRPIRDLYDDFAVIKTDDQDKKTRYGCPINFNRLTVSWYLNHSKAPNVRCGKDYKFSALRDIERGEELTVDYSTYSEEP